MSAPQAAPRLVLATQKLDSITGRDTRTAQVEHDPRGATAVTSSYWFDEPSQPLPLGALSGRPDAIVVGGGVTGCACALALAQAGMRVRLHEAREIAGGASGRNGGFALRGGAMPYAEARQELGPGAAVSLWRLTERYLGRLGRLAGDAFRPVGSLKLAADLAERDELQAEFDALRDDGFEAEWLDELPMALVGRFPAAIRYPRDGALQPARWARRLAALAADAGVEINERSRVESLDQLDATHVVIATDGYSQGLLPELEAAVQPTRGQVVVTEPLEEQLFPCPHYARHGFDYWQQLPDGRLVAGGRRDASLETENTAVEETTKAIQAQIEALVRELLGRLPRITHRWAGLFGTTADRLPLVGPVPGREGVWVAAGYSGHGNVMGLACGELVAQAVLDQPAPELELFNPGRLPAAP
jgi:gamma-glutamylputrescine oxidase